MKLGLDKNSLYRIQSAFSHLLKQSSENEGNVCLPQNILINKSHLLLNIDKNLIEETLTNTISSKNLICNDYQDNKYIYLPYLFEKENQFASYITQMIIKTNNNKIYKLITSQKILLAKNNNKQLYDALNTFSASLQEDPELAKQPQLKKLFIKLKKTIGM